MRLIAIFRTRCAGQVRLRPCPNRTSHAPPSRARRNRLRHRRQFRPGALARAHCAAEQRDARVDRPGHDIERLEASLRWLQRQERPPRLARSERPFRRLSLRCAGRAGQPALRSSSLAAVIGAERLAPPPQPQRSWQLPSAVAIGCVLAARSGTMSRPEAGGRGVRCRRLHSEASVPAQVVAAWLPKQRARVAADRGA